MRLQHAGSANSRLLRDNASDGSRLVDQYITYLTTRKYIHQLSTTFVFVDFLL